MKQIKFYCTMICAAAFLYSCEKESLSTPEEEAVVQDKIIFSDFVNSGIDVDQYIENVLANEVGTKSYNKSHSTATNEEALFNEYCSDLPLEDFEEGRQPSGTAGIFNGPLNSVRDTHKFLPGEILSGISISTNGKVLAIYGQGTRGNLSKVIYSNYGNTSLYIDFTTDDVNSVSLDVLSFPYPDSDASQQITVEVFNLQGELIHSEQLTASIEGTEWAINADESISKITLSSTNNDAWIGVDNIAFGECYIPDADNDGCVDDNDNNDNSNFEATINVGSCDSGVPNRSTPECGMTLSDLVDGLETGSYKNKGQFIQAVAHATDGWVSADLISSAEKDAIVSCAANANL